jgi:hypothetical protein
LKETANAQTERKRYREGRDKEIKKVKNGGIEKGKMKRKDEGKEEKNGGKRGRDGGKSGRDGRN